MHFLWRTYLSIHGLDALVLHWFYLCSLFSCQCNWKLLDVFIVIFLLILQGCLFLFVLKLFSEFLKDSLIFFSFLFCVCLVIQFGLKQGEISAISLISLNPTDAPFLHWDWSVRSVLVSADTIQVFISLITTASWWQTLWIF